MLTEQGTIVFFGFIVHGMFNRVMSQAIITKPITITNICLLELITLHYFYTQFQATEMESSSTRTIAQ